MLAQRLKLQQVRFFIAFVALVAFVISLYAYYVEDQLQRNPKYVPQCDFNEHINCTKALNSIYGRGFGVFNKMRSLNKPNSYYGMIFYASVIILRQVGIFLTVLRTFCVVCVSVYTLNYLLLILQKSETNLLKKIN